jgi:hypothetical protein
VARRRPLAATPAPPLADPREPGTTGAPDPAPAALRAVFRIFDAWGLSTDDARRLLGDPPASTYFKWKKGDTGRIPRDTLERASYLLGIYKALQLLFPDPAIADGWIRRPNTAPGFEGQSALDRLRGGNVADLDFVRRYLDAQRGGWP